MSPAVKAAEKSADAAALSETEATEPSLIADEDDPFTDEFGALLSAALNESGESETAAEDEDAPADGETPDGETDTPADGDEAGEGAGEDEPAGDEAAATEGAPAAAGETKTTGTAPAAAWEPFTVKAGKVDPNDPDVVPIPEASISRVNGSVLIGMSEKDFGRFQQRVSRGIYGERLNLQLQRGIRELEARKAQPARKTDAEIAAEITHEYLKPFISEFLDAQQLETLELKVKLAQREEADRFAREEGERVTKASEPTWEEAQQVELAKMTRGVYDTFKDELGEFTPEELREVFDGDLMPVRDALVTRSADGKDVFGNTQYIKERLMARAALKRSQSPATPRTPASALAAGTVKADSPARPASPNGQTPKGEKAERFNRAVDTGATRTTSLKANRTPGTRKRPPAAEDGQRRRPTPDEEHAKAELDLRRMQRRILSAPGFDLGDDGDDEE